MLYPRSSNFKKWFVKRIHWSRNSDLVPPQARARIGNKIGIQGNLDPAVLLGPKEIIKERTEEILQHAVGNYHIMVRSQNCLDGMVI